MLAWQVPLYGTQSLRAYGAKGKEHQQRCGVKITGVRVTWANLGENCMVETYLGKPEAHCCELSGFVLEGREPSPQMQHRFGVNLTDP